LQQIGVEAAGLGEQQAHIPAGNFRHAEAEEPLAGGIEGVDAPGGIDGEQPVAGVVDDGAQAAFAAVARRRGAAQVVQRLAKGVQHGGQLADLVAPAAGGGNTACSPRMVCSSAVTMAPIRAGDALTISQKLLVHSRMAARKTAASHRMALREAAISRSV